MTNWVFVETYHNWNQDKKHNFKFLGIRMQVVKSRGLKKNDLIFMYVSKIKKFSDVRVIENIDLIDLPSTLKYDKDFIKCIETKIVKELSVDEWIELKKLNNKLSFLKSEEFLGFLLLRAPIKIDDNDKKILLNEFNFN